VGHQDLPRDQAREEAVTPSFGRRRLVAATAAMAWLAGAAPAALAQTEPGAALARIRARGRLVVGVYNDLPPFHVAGRGIDVDVAEALARALGLELTLLPFNADENMNDDLRNLVWRGHYLGFGPADVLLHVPVDAPLMQGNPQVQIFAPYFRERVMIARDLQRVPKLDSLADLAGQQIAVPGQSLAGWLLIGADGGAYREQLVTRLANGVDAARALQRGDVAAAAGHASELESALAGDRRFAIVPLPVPRLRDGWAVGFAVKRQATDLAQALQAAVNDLSRSGELARVFDRAGVSWRAP
jgi:ABC-type amino acid transport substrate-binding protein